MLKVKGSFHFRLEVLRGLLIFLLFREFIRPFSFRSICSHWFLTFTDSSSENSFFLRKISFNVTTSNIDPWAICKN